MARNDVRYEWLHAKRSCEYDWQNAHENHRMMQIDERNRCAILERQQQRLAGTQTCSQDPVCQPVAHLPSGTPVQYVPVEQADLQPAGPVIDFAFGKSIRDACSGQPNRLRQGRGQLPARRAPFTGAQAQPIAEDTMAMKNRIQEQNRRLILEQEQRNLRLTSGQLPDSLKC